LGLQCCWARPPGFRSWPVEWGKIAAVSRNGGVHACGRASRDAETRAIHVPGRVGRSSPAAVPSACVSQTKPRASLRLCGGRGSAGFRKAGDRSRYGPHERWHPSAGAEKREVGDADTGIATETRLAGNRAFETGAVGASIDAAFREAWHRGHMDATARQSLTHRLPHTARETAKARPAAVACGRPLGW